VGVKMDNIVPKGFYSKLLKDFVFHVSMVKRNVWKIVYGNYKHSSVIHLTREGLLEVLK
jgi:hypothetical protein